MAKIIDTSVPLKGKDLTGLKFNRLTVVRYVGGVLRKDQPKFQRYWLCRCDCGAEITAVSQSLSSGNTRSCGCARVESVMSRNLVHGMAHHHKYGMWLNMRQRCENPDNPGYANYGRRGIYVCEEWKSFPKFWEDMGPTWAKGLEIERKDNDGPYCKDNCIWADRITQTNNTRRNVFLSLGGAQLTVVQWARKLGLRPGMIYHRIERGVECRAGVDGA